MSIAIETLKDRVAEYIGTSRMTHTLGVCETALRIADCFKNIDRDDLMAAALLHDVAKELDTAVQLDLIREYRVPVSGEDLETLPALHSFAAVALIKRDFPQYCKDNIISAVAKHTLGDVSMTLFDKIVYISDYVEPGRTHPACVAVRDRLFAALSASNEVGNELAVNAAIIESVKNTEEYLSAKGSKINSRSREMLRYLLSLN